MARYRKKPVVIEAVQFNGTTDEVRNFVHGEGVPKVIWPDQGLGDDCEYLIVKTLEGDMRCDLGDWIIKGVEGEFYPCKPKIFEQLYDKLDD